MIFWSEGSPRADIRAGEAKAALVNALAAVGRVKRVIVVPPDCTRLHSQAGPLTEAAWEYYGEKLGDVLPATGTHSPMTEAELAAMFGRVPPRLFRVHDWREGTRSLGEVPADFVRDASEGRVRDGIPVEVDRLIADGKHDLVLSIGQVVPHEVVGMAGHAKNIFIGTGGSGAINKTHFLGAAYGMERIMGRAETPVRRVLRYAADRFAGHLPIVYVLTVVGRGGDGKLALRGLFIGDDEECFRRAAALSGEVNIELLDRPLEKVVVYLDPAEFKSTWLGNKSIYRTRLAIADGGELVVLAPGVSRFGEDPVIDGLVRKYGYAGTPKILDLTEREEDLRRNLSAAAHLIHGSSEGRFTVTYCPGGLTRPEVESVNFHFAELDVMMKRYDPRRLAEGFNTMPDGERIFFISNPALGLWADKARFQREKGTGA